MATVRDIATRSLKEIGVLAASETPTAEEGADALSTLNDLVNQWAAERLQIYTVTRTEWTITPSDGSYTVGTGGDVNVLRPVSVNEVRLMDTTPAPDIEYPLTKLTEDGYAAIPQKAMTSVWPTSWYYNPTYPLATLIVWPVPTASGLKGVMYAPQAVASFADINATIDLPPGYLRMIVKNLAVEMAPMYGRQADGNLVAQAREAKEVVKRANRRLSDLSVDAAVVQGGRWFDFHTGV